jgi:hypothetical protein
MLARLFSSSRNGTGLGPLLVIFLVGCGLKLDALATPTIEPSLVDRSILTGVPCQAPCWHGLVPGQSTKAEVLATGQGLSFLDPKALSEEPYGYYDQAKQGMVPGTMLRLGCKRPGGGTCASLLLVDGTLKEIYLSPPPSLTFEEAVAHLGAPDFVRRYPVDANPSVCNLAMIWKRRAIWLAFLNGQPKKDRVRCADVGGGRGVDPGLPVELVIYSTPDDSAIASAPQPGGDFAWPGFAKP